MSSASFCALGQSDVYSSRGYICVAVSAGPGGLVAATVSLRKKYLQAEGAPEVDSIKCSSTRHVSLPTSAGAAANTATPDDDDDDGDDDGDDDDDDDDGDDDDDDDDDGEITVSLYVIANGLYKMASETCSAASSSPRPSSKSGASGPIYSPSAPERRLCTKKRKNNQIVTYNAAAAATSISSSLSPASASFYSILWHPSGDRLCVVSQDGIFILHISYTLGLETDPTVPATGGNRNTSRRVDGPMAPPAGLYIGLSEAVRICRNEGCNDDPPSSPKVLAHMRIAAALNVRGLGVAAAGIDAEGCAAPTLLSACCFDASRFLAIGTSAGEVLKMSWEGVLLERAVVSSGHSLLRTWDGQSSFFAFSSSLPVITVSSSGARGGLRRGMADPNPNPNVSDSSAIAADEPIHEPEPSIVTGNGIVSFEWSECLRLFLVGMADGSVLFMQSSQPSRSSGSQQQQACLLCTDRVHVASLLRSTIAAGAVEGSPRKLRRSDYGSVLLDDVEMTRTRKAASTRPGTNNNNINNNNSSNSSNVEEVISKIVGVCLVDAPDCCSSNGALMAAVLQTKHLPILASDGDTYVRKESLSIAVFQLQKQRQQQLSSSDLDSSSSKSATNSSISMSCSNLVRVADLLGATAAASTHAPTLSVLHIAGAPPLLLIACMRVLTAHPLLSIRTTVFRIDTNSLCIPSPLHMRCQNNSSPTGAINSTGAVGHEDKMAVLRRRYSRVQRVLVSVALGQLIVATTNITNRTINRPCDSSHIHVVPLYSLLNSRLGLGLLLDVSGNRLIQHSMDSVAPRVDLDWAGATNSTSAGPPTPSAGVGSFTSLFLPRNVILELLDAHAAASTGAYLQPGHSGRQQQGGLLVAATRLPRQGGAIFDDLVSGLCGPGYLAAAVGGIEWPPLPTSPTAAASAPYCLSLWLYSKQTRRWRSTCMDITASSRVTAYSSAATVSSNNNNNNNKSLPYSGATLLDGRGDEAAAARRAVNCALTASFSLSWFEDHSLVLTTRRRGRFCLEVLSRAVTRDSLARGAPTPVVHKVVLLPPGLYPSFVDSKVVLLQLANSRKPTAVCVVAISDGSNFISFSIQAVLSKQTDIIDYQIHKLFESELPIRSSNTPSSSSSSSSSFSSPMLKMSVLVYQDVSMFKVALLLLDRDGRLFSLQDGDSGQPCGACCLYDPGPFTSVSTLESACVPLLSGSGSDSRDQISGIIALQSNNQLKNRIIIVPAIAPSCDSSSTTSILFRFYAVSTDPPPQDSVGLGWAAGNQLHLCRPPTISLYVQDDCRHYDHRVDFTIMKQKMSSYSRHLVVSKSCVLFDIFMQLLRLPNIANRSTTTAAAASLSPHAPIPAEVALYCTEKLYNSLGGSAMAVIDFYHSCELELKRLAETMFRRGIGSTGHFYALTTALHNLDPVLLGELVSVISRKADPATCKKLFPVLPPTETDSHRSTSALSLFDSCVRRGSSLAQASRLLTIACEHTMAASPEGGGDRRALEMALELLLEALDSCSLALALQCTEFCIRLEAMVNAHPNHDPNYSVVSGSIMEPRENGLIAIWEWAINRTVEFVAPLPVRGHQRSLPSAIAPKGGGDTHYRCSRLLAASSCGRCGSSRVMALLASCITDMVSAGRYAAAATTVMTVFSTAKTAELLYTYFDSISLHYGAADAEYDGDDDDDDRSLETILGIIAAFDIAEVAVGTHLQRKLTQPLQFSRLRNLCKDNKGLPSYSSSNGGDGKFQFDVPEPILLSMSDERSATSSTKLLSSFAISLLMARRRYARVSTLFFYCLGLHELGNVLALLYDRNTGDGGGDIETLVMATGTIVRSLLHPRSNPGLASGDSELLATTVEDLYASNTTIDFSEIDDMWSEGSRSTVREAVEATHAYLRRCRNSAAEA